MSKGEMLDRIVSYGTPLFLMLREALTSLVKSPEIQKAVTEKLIEMSKDGRTRADELVFFVSLITLENVSQENKMLFLTKHKEMLNPDLNGKSQLEKNGLLFKQKMAKGFIFLIATDPSASEKDPKKRFVLANEIWYGIFMGVDSCPDNNSKLRLLEERIIHLGKNNQDRITLEEIAKPVGNFFSKWLSEESVEKARQDYNAAKSKRRP